MPRKPASEKKEPAKKTVRKKKADTEVIAAPVVEETPVKKKRGRKPAVKAVEPVAEVVEVSANAAPVAEETPVKKKRGRKPAVKAVEPVTEVVETPVNAEPVVETSAIETTTIAEPVSETPDIADAPKKARKPRKKKKDNAPVLTTIVQLGDTEFDITGIAEKAYKSYKSVHKRKVITDFRIYVKPEENAAYFTINGEGSADYKIDL